MKAKQLVVEVSSDDSSITKVVVSVGEDEDFELDSYYVALAEKELKDMLVNPFIEPVREVRIYLREVS